MSSLIKKVLVTGLLIAFGFYLYTRPPDRNPSLVSWGDRLILRLVGPFAGAVHFGGRHLRRVGSYFSLLSTAVKENELLTEELARLRLKNQELEGEASEAVGLRELFGFQKNFPEKLIAARVISYPPLSAYRMVMIDKGSRAGVTRRAAVLSPVGVVGQVSRVAETYAEVLLIIDPTSTVDARVEATGARGLIVGKALSIGLKRDLFLGAFEYLSRIDEVADGQRVVTTGLDGVYPAGLAIGEVGEVHKNSYGIFQEVDLVPAVDFDRLREVFVVARP